MRVHGRPSRWRVRRWLGAWASRWCTSTHIVPSLTVAENVFLGEELLTRRRTLDRRRMASKLADVSRRYGLVIDPTSRVCELSAGVRQRVEILKALYFNARVLILDEPSAILTPQETEPPCSTSYAAWPIAGTRWC